MLSNKKKLDKLFSNKHLVFLQFYYWFSLYNYIMHHLFPQLFLLHIIVVVFINQSLKHNLINWLKTGYFIKLGSKNPNKIILK